MSQVYVANFIANRVDVFLRNDFARGIVNSISVGVSSPQGIFVDDGCNLYVANGDESGNDTVTYYPNGERQPARIYRGIKFAVDVTVGRDGVVYVADYDGQRVVEFGLHGEQLRQVYPGGFPMSVTLDPHNNLFVGYNMSDSYLGEVKRYRPAATDGTTVIPSNIVYFIGGIAIDGRGALLVANQGYGVIDVFARSNKPPTSVLKSGQATPLRLAFDRRENKLYVSSPFIGDLLPGAASAAGTWAPTSKANTVVELSYPIGKPLATWRRHSWVPEGVAISPRAPF